MLTYGTNLGQHVDLDDPAVDAVAHRHVNEAVRPANWHGRLGTHLRERIKPCPGATAEDDGSNTLRRYHILRLRKVAAYQPRAGAELSAKTVEGLKTGQRRALEASFVKGAGAASAATSSLLEAT